MVYGETHGKSRKFARGSQTVVWRDASETEPRPSNAHTLAQMGSSEYLAVTKEADENREAVRSSNAATLARMGLSEHVKVVPEAPR